MNIPNFPQSKFLTKDGDMHPEWQDVLRDLFNILQKNLSNEGYKLPHQEPSIIARLNTDKSMGSILYNSTTGKGMINESGVYKTITTS